MSPLRWKLLPAVLLVVSALHVAHGGAATEPESEPTELGAMRADPSSWLGRRVRFTIQFDERLSRWNPGLTRFGSTDWTGISAWADEDFTWEASVFEFPMTRLFVRRGSGEDDLLGRARRYERFEVTGIVREVFLNDPWIEIESLHPLFELVGEGTILHVGRAYAFARQEKWDLAVDQFERAKSAPIPAAARAQLERKIAECQRLKLE